MEFNSPGVFVRDTGTSKGRGVFAARAHAKGETIESCPAVLFSGMFAEIPDEVRKLLYHWSYATNGRSTHCLALGYGSLYNHDNPANMRFEAMKEAKLLRFVAVRAIEQGEELTVNYNAISGEHRSEDDVWFTGMGLTPFDPSDVQS